MASGGIQSTTNERMVSGKTHTQFIGDSETMPVRELFPFPYLRAFEIEPDDTKNVRATGAIYIGGPGKPGQNARIQVTMGGEVVIFENVLVGTIIPISVIRVWKTNTTATNIIGLY